MASPVAHPRRRRAQKATSPESSPSLPSPTMSLRKSDTFSARTSISSDLASPFENHAYMPKRSPTNPLSLEDLLADGERLNYHQKKAAKLLKEFDDTIQGHSHLSGDASILKDQEVLAVPTFMVNKVSVPEPMDVDKKPVVTEHHHRSDSGIGSSIASSRSEHRAATHSSICGSIQSSITATRSAVTKSASNSDALQNPTEHFLTPEAVNHIQKRIIAPILKEPSLKEFHPLIEDIPRRIGAKFISNLRDLEKTLFFLAPDFCSSPTSFLKFCEASIQCLHTTVDFLSERDQRRPTDRPYTNSYFIDLVEQIRRYAEIMARTREKEAAGQELDEMDYSPDEEISLEGGLTKNGKPAELVRNKNGKIIPLSHNSALDKDTTMLKRPFTDDEDDEDEVHRSMARRRKSDRPGDIMHPCQVCDKEFKRPCDLTKHEKTHSRPWKCPEPKCRYHEMGWPTEKERDRHVNDKHSASPTMYKCKFPPCTYSSKRESNCKQHMEKAHGWEYVRSKSNGRKKGSVGSTNRTPATPLTPFMTTPSSENNHLSTPETTFDPSPALLNDMEFNSFNFPPFGSNFAPAPTADELYAWDDTRRDSTTTYSTGFSSDQPKISSFDDAISPDDVKFNHNMLDGSTGFDLNLTTAPFQQPTPALSVVQNFDTSPLSMMHNNAVAGPSNGVHHLSPNGQGDLTLYSPNMDMPLDEGLGEMDMNYFRSDFTLFDTNSTFGNTTTSTSWVPEANLDNFGGFDFGMGDTRDPFYSSH